MVFYHGNCIANFEIERYKPSRYGFPALFLTSSLELARLYALWHYQQTWANGGGMVYAIEVDVLPTDVRDWNGKTSYCGDFRNRIRGWSHVNWDNLRLQDVVDTPQKSMFRPLLSDIIIVYNLDTIKSITLLESGITQI